MAPSEKHNELALLGLTWIGNKATARGTRGTTEVTLDQGYVADAVVLCRLQDRFFERYCEHSHLKPIIGHGVLDRTTGKVVYEWNGEVGNYFACILEAKATRADFLSTFNDGEKHKNRHKPIGNLHWCISPKGLVRPDELPDFWGLLEPYGAGLTEKKMPVINLLSDTELDRIAHQLIWPLQAYRGYTNCQKCGKWISKGYCGRCFMKAPVASERSK